MWDSNNLSTTKYYPGEYESVTLERDTNGNKRYIIDMFMYDIADRYNIRILIDIVDKDNKYHLNNIRMVNADEETISLIGDIYGIDTNPECKKLEEENVSILIGSQSDRNFLIKVKDLIPELN